MLSIIIPTLNEQKYLPLLLDSIKRQSFDDFEVIVADAGSQDKTVEVARKYGCRVIPGGLLAKGRNEGAKAAQGDTLLFLDADAVLPPGFLEKVLLEFKERNLGIASCPLLPITNNRFYRMVFHPFYNWPARFLEDVRPYASNFILVKKDIHERLGGFDEEIKIAEDHSYVRRAAKITKFGFLGSAKLPFFPRRYQHDGWLTIAVKYYFCNLYNLFFGDVKSDIFRYKCGEFKREKKISKAQKLILEGLKFPLYLFWIPLGLATWLIIFLIFTPEIILSKIKVWRKSI